MQIDSYFRIPLITSPSESTNGPDKLNVLPLSAFDTEETPPKEIKSTRNKNACQTNLDTPKTHKLEKSVEDLWTDEELFDSDSFLIATQDLMTTAGSPHNHKRKIDTTESNAKVARFSFRLKHSTKVSSDTTKSSDWKVPAVPAKTAHSTTTLPMPFKSYQKPQVPIDKNSKQNTTVTNKNMLKSKNCSVSSASANNNAIHTNLKAAASASLTASSAENSIKPCSTSITTQSHHTAKVPSSRLPINTSISDELLAALAEPDDILDSQECMFDDSLDEDKIIVGVCEIKGTDITSAYPAALVTDVPIAVSVATVTAVPTTISATNVATVHTAVSDTIVTAMPTAVPTAMVTSMPAPANKHPGMTR